MIVLKLTIASLKMTFRNKQFFFFSLFLPLIIMGIFGIMDFDRMGNASVGVVDLAHNQASTTFLDALTKVTILQVSQGDEQAELKALEKGDRHLVLTIPPDFGQAQPAILRVRYNQGKMAQAQVGIAAINQVLAEASRQITHSPLLFKIEQEGVSSRNLRYVDFLMPGVVAMSIMQMGIFGVALTIVRYRETGVMRRLLATPLKSMDFLASQVITRLVVSLLQTGFLIGIGLFAFKVQVTGSYLLIVLLSILGGTVFLTMGFAVSGYAKTADTAGVLANVVAMPMMFISGVFFPVETMPDVVREVSKYLPLTYLADGLRGVINEGASVSAIQTPLLGLAAWTIVGFVAAIRLHRWE